MAKKNVEVPIETSEVVENTGLEGLVETPAEVPAEKPAKVVVDIIRGRMPLIIVHMIKFAAADVKDAALAAKFRTTVGKVSDIRKNRNFEYVTQDMPVSQDMLDKAKAFAKDLIDETVLPELEAMTVSDEAAIKAFEEARKISRPGRKKAETAPATEGEAPAEESSEDVDPDLEGLV